MILKKIIVFVLAISFAIFIVSCDYDKNEKEEQNEDTETEQTEAKEDASIKTAVLPSGEIALDKLPAGLKEFVEKNYTGYTINKAASDPFCQGGDAIDVAVTKAGAPNLSLIFKPDGGFVQQEEDLAMATAPDKVKNELKAKFADYKAGNLIERITLADKTVQYLVDLNKGAATKEVIFNTAGMVVCEK